MTIAAGEVISEENDVGSIGNCRQEEAGDGEDKNMIMTGTTVLLISISSGVFWYIGQLLTAL